MRGFLIALTFVCLATGAVAAAVPDTTWQALQNRQVVVTNTDGTQVTGTLALVKSESISLILADGSVVTLAKGKIEGVRALVTASAKASTTANAGTSAPLPQHPRIERASSSASMAMGIQDADSQYHSAWWLGGFFLGPIGVALSYTSHPTPAVMPDSAKVDVNSFVVGYQQEAERKDHTGAWLGFAVEVLILVIAAAASSSNSTAAS